MAKPRRQIIDRKTRSEVMEEIRLELMASDIEGRPATWYAIQGGYPSVPDGTFFRWVRMAKRGEEFPEDRRNRNRAKMAAVEISAEVSKHLPAPVSPGFFLQNVNALAMIDSGAELAKVLRWRDMLYRYATTAGVDGADDQVRRPQPFVQVIKTTVDVVKEVELLKAKIWNIQKLERIYALMGAIIFEEIGPEMVELRQRIIVRMRQADALYLLTPNAPV